MITSTIPADIEKWFNSVVAVEYDSNADGSQADFEGMVAPIWVPLPGDGYTALRCRICEQESQRAPGQEFSEDLTIALILFPISSKLPNNKVLRFKYTDPLIGDTYYYYANGKITNPGKMNNYLRVMTRLGAIQ